MKKNNKGFTLLELLLVIFITLSIIGIVIYSVNKISTKKKEEAYVEIKKQIMTAGKQFFETNEYLFEGLGENSIGTVPLYVLVKNDYINTVVDPRNGKTINLCNEVVITKKDGKFITKYTENDKNKCDISKHGVVVSEPGAPSLNPSFYNLNNKKVVSPTNEGWLNISKLGENRGAGVNLNAEENNNGPIIKASVDGKNLAVSEKVIVDEDTFNNQIDKSSHIYTVTNSSGKTAKKEIYAGVDSIRPVVTVKNPYNNVWFNKEAQNRSPYGVLLSYNAVENGSGINKWYWWSNDDKSHEQWNVFNGRDGQKDISTYYNFEGNYNAWAKVTDIAGNSSNEPVTNIKIDTISPSGKLKTIGNKKTIVSTGQPSGQYTKDHRYLDTPLYTETTKPDSFKEEITSVENFDGWYASCVTIVPYDFSSDITSWWWENVTSNWKSSWLYGVPSRDDNSLFISSNGSNDVRFHVFDIAGNESIISKNDIKIDTVAPSFNSLILKNDTSYNKDNPMKGIGTFSDTTSTVYFYGYDYRSCYTCNKTPRTWVNGKVINKASNSYEIAFRCPSKTESGIKFYIVDSANNLTSKAKIGY